MVLLLVTYQYVVVCVKLSTSPVCVAIDIDIDTCPSHLVCCAMMARRSGARFEACLVVDNFRP